MTLLDETIEQLTARKNEYTLLVRRTHRCWGPDEKTANQVVHKYSSFSSPRHMVKFYFLTNFQVRHHHMTCSGQRKVCGNDNVSPCVTAMENCRNWCGICTWFPSAKVMAECLIMDVPLSPRMKTTWTRIPHQLVTDINSSRLDFDWAMLNTQKNFIQSLSVFPDRSYPIFSVRIGGLVWGRGWEKKLELLRWVSRLSLSSALFYNNISPLPLLCKPPGFCWGRGQVVTELHRLGEIIWGLCSNPTSSF